MKKHLSVFILTVFVLSILAVACGCQKGVAPDNDTGEPESNYAYWLLEECADDTNYLTIQSLAITNSYNNSQAENSGYYVVLEVNTNLREENFSDIKNQSELWIAAQQSLTLSLEEWDSENNKLVYSIPYDESVDYEQLSGLTASNDAQTEYPFVSICFDCFNNYCMIDGVNYAGRYFMIKLV